MFKLLFISSALALSAATYLNRDGGVSVCAEHYTGENCDVYKPTRHCADLKQFHGIDKSGYYNIMWKEKGYELEVYCDMETEGGGWTLMSSAEGAEFANVTYAQYQKPFGGKGKSVDWLGLDNIAAMTQAAETSLRVDLHKCGLSGNRKKLHLMDTYPSFRVNSADKGYSVFIPLPKSGNNTEDDEGWVHWDESKEGPVFSTYDRDLDGCSGAMGNTGWWFRHTEETCQQTNLNGVRSECAKDKEHDQSLVMYLSLHIKQASMWLRPRQFPVDTVTTSQTRSHPENNG